MKRTCSIVLSAAMGMLSYAMPYAEPIDSVVKNPDEWLKISKGTHFSWGDKDTKYAHMEVPATVTLTDTTINVWRGERAGLSAVIYSTVTTSPLKLELTDWTHAGKKVKAPGCTARFVNYVLTDAYDRCGYHPDTLPSFTVPDVIDVETSKSIAANSTRPVWVTLEVPRDIKPGTYQTSLRLLDAANDKQVGKLTLNINVQNHTLPLPTEQKFHLNLWQQPYSVSRYYNVAPWSDEHIKLLKPYIERLARAGQSAASVILFYEPWGEQSNDKFQPMVETVKKADGTWHYDYTVLDKWINLLDSMGINKIIECYTMIPWEMSFRYFDEKKGDYEFLVTSTATPEYKELWTAFLRSFANHMKEKGWYDRTVITMDERNINDMLNAYQVAQEAVPGLKMALHGSYHENLIDNLYSCTVTMGHEEFPSEVLDRRRANNQISCLYTCCSSPAPNYFSNNATADAAYIPVYCTATGHDGYLHWSYMNWTDNPLVDTRFKLFAPGDTYFIYPDNRSSVRYERMVEGIQLSEKIRLLHDKFINENNASALAALEKALIPIRTGITTVGITTGDIVNTLQRRVTALSEP